MSRICFHCHKKIIPNCPIMHVSRLGTGLGSSYGRDRDIITQAAAEKTSTIRVRTKATSFSPITYLSSPGIELGTCWKVASSNVVGNKLEASAHKTIGTCHISLLMLRVNLQAHLQWSKRGTAGKIRTLTLHSEGKHFTPAPHRHM